MKNVTVSLDDDTYRRARRYAAENDSSLSAIVRDHLNKLGTSETEFERLAREERELREKMRGSGFSASDRLTRDELYDRAARRKEWEEILRGE